MFHAFILLQIFQSQNMPCRFCQLYWCNDWRTGWLIFWINSVIQRIIDSSFALVCLFWQFKSVKSLAIQCLDLWHCIFEHCSSWYGSETIFFACAAYVEGQRPSGCSPTSRPSSPTSRPTCSLSMPRQSMKSMTVSSMEASALSPGALGHSMTPVAGLGPVACLGPVTGELLCPSLPSFLRVSPFRKTQDLMVDGNLMPGLTACTGTPAPWRSLMK